MSGGSVLFGLLLLQVAVLLARPGAAELRARKDRPRSHQIHALRFVTGGIVLGGLGIVLFLDAVGWSIGRPAAAAGSLAAVGALLGLTAAELIARLCEDREGERRRRELGLPSLPRVWQPAAVVLLWTLLVPAAGAVAFGLEIALRGWDYASGAHGELIDALALAAVLALAFAHVAYHRRRSRLRDLRPGESAQRTSTARRRD